MTPRLKTIEIGLLVSERLRPIEQGRRFFDLLQAMAPAFTPEYFNTHEPVNILFNQSEALNHWGQSFLWRRTKPSVSGQIVMGPQSAHDAIYLTLPPKALDDRVPILMMELSKLFGVVLAYVHVRTNVDGDDIEHYRRYIMPFSQGLTTHHLRDGLPDLPWATLFGQPYVDLFGRERLLATPAARIISDDAGVYIQLTNSVTDVVSQQDEYQVAKLMAKRHLDGNAFRGDHPTLRIPEFFPTIH